MLTGSRCLYHGSLMLFFSPLFYLSTSVLIHTRPPQLCAATGFASTAATVVRAPPSCVTVPLASTAPAASTVSRSFNAWLSSCFLGHKTAVASLRRTSPCAPVPTEPTVECSAFCSTSTLNSFSRDHFSSTSKGESPHISTWLLQQQSQYFISHSTVVVRAVKVKPWHILLFCPIAPHDRKFLLVSIHPCLSLKLGLLRKDGVLEEGGLSSRGAYEKSRLSAFCF